VFVTSLIVFRAAEVMAEDNTGIFDTWDYVVLGVMLVISASIGVYYRFTGGRQKTTQVSIPSPVSILLQD
jgi:hypothetical protein